ncbi:MAG: GTP-binding protein [Clostridia bacterium]|nr:GTP-binding protein [Clostridia bacterium]
MTKIDIISGFLGAGKTTLIKKLLEEVYAGEKLVLIENEFGEIGIDGGFLKDSGIEITEMNSGCICCSLVGDFGEALVKVLEQYNPDRVIIEPSGVGKLSDVIKAVKRVGHEGQMELGNFVTVADATKARVYMKNFGEFYNDQIEAAGAIILSRTQGMDEEKLRKAVDLLRERNENAPILTTPWDVLTGAQIMEAMEGISLAEKLQEELEHEHEHHHHHDDDDECCCGHHHHHDDDDDDDDEHEHHHHHHDEDCCDHDHEHEHHHHHEDGEECSCGHHHEHGHHHADEVFTSWGAETINKFSEEQLRDALKALDSLEYGTVLRAKGIVMSDDGEWFHYDYVPGEISIRKGAADYTGRLCVIGSDLDEDGLKKLFNI